MNDIFAGTYTGGKSRGIYSCSFRDDSPVRLEAELDNPSYLLFLEQERRLYAVSESDAGKVTAYRMEREQLVCDGRLLTDSGGLVHIAADPEHSCVFTASYADARVQMIRLSAAGIPERVLYSVQHTGSGADPERQNTAHAHSVWLTPDSKELCVCDLGTDRVAVYRIDHDTGMLRQRDDRTIFLPAGSGPRHMAFDPTGTYAYVLTELTSEIYAYSWSPERSFTFIQKTALMSRPDPANSAAAIRISADGRFVYATCRGADTIVAFARCEDGSLTNIQTVPSGGGHPRDCILAYGDAMLVCANRDSDNVVFFARDRKTGFLTPVKTVSGIPSPIALQYIPERGSIHDEDRT